MEHETRLWTEPYNDEKYGEEKGASWKYFQAFIKMDSPRTLVGFHKALSKELSKQGRKRIPSYQTLCEYSSAWKWMMRAEAYDNYIRDVEDEEMKEKIRRIRNKAIDMMSDRFDFHEELREELKEDETLATNQKVYGFAKNTEGLRNDVISFNELINEGKTKLDANMDAEIKSESKIEHKSTKTIYDEVDRALGLDTNDTDNG